MFMPLYIGVPGKQRLKRVCNSKLQFHQGRFVEAGSGSSSASKIVRIKANGNI